MEEKQTMTQAQLEAALSRRRGSITLFKILTYGSGLAAVLLLAAGLVPVALICLVLAFVFGYRLSKNTAALKTLLSGNIVSGVLREVFEDVEYEPFGRIPDGTVRGAGMVFPFAYDSIRGSDHIKAVYRGLRLELGDVELYAADSYYDEELQQWKQSEKRVFKGQWLVCDFDRPLPGEVRLSENARVLRRQHKGDCVETESAAFNAHFLVTAEDARAAREVLTPRRMEDILAAADRSGGEVYMAFLRGRAAARRGSDRAGLLRARQGRGGRRAAAAEIPRRAALVHGHRGHALPGGDERMTLGTATLLLLLALGSIAACRVCLRKKRSLRRACVAALSVLALALIVYIGLTVLLVGAVQSQPPV